MDGDPGPRSPKERRCLSRRRESALSSCNQDAEAPGGPGLRLRLRLSRLRLLLQSLSSACPRSRSHRNPQFPGPQPRAPGAPPAGAPPALASPRRDPGGTAAAGAVPAAAEASESPPRRPCRGSTATLRGWAPAREPRKLRRGKSQEERDACCSAVVLLCWQQHKPGPYKPCCRRRRACQRRGSGHRHGLGTCLKTTLRAHPASAQLKPPQPQSLTIGRGAAHGVGT